MALLDRLVGWALDQEPVRAATGLAGGVAAVIGVLAAWDVWEPSPEQIAAIAALVTWVAGAMARRRAWSPASVEQLRVVTAGEAATRTAVDLGRAAVGPAGDITEEGLDVVSDVIDEVTGTEDDPEAGLAPIAVLIGLAVLIAALFWTCDAVFDDEDEADDVGWVPRVEKSEPPRGRPGPGRDGEGCGDRSDGCGNENGRDCYQSTGECSDDDQIQVGPICVEDGACRFG